jgi:hypothetical protein
MEFKRVINKTFHKLINGLVPTCYTWICFKMRNPPNIDIEIKYDKTIKSYKISQNKYKWHFTLETHLYYLMNKLSVAGYAIRVFKHLMPLKTLVIIYYSYFHTLMNYRILFWSKSPYSMHKYRLQN